MWLSAKPPVIPHGGVIIDMATIFVKLGIHPASEIPSQYLQKPLETLLRDVIDDKFKPHP
jgi:hypothetical protein